MLSKRVYHYRLLVQAAQSKERATLPASAHRNHAIDFSTCFAYYGSSLRPADAVGYGLTPAYTRV